MSTSKVFKLIARLKSTPNEKLVIKTFFFFSPSFNLAFKISKLTFGDHFDLNERTNKQTNKQIVIKKE